MFGCFGQKKAIWGQPNPAATKPEFANRATGTVYKKSTSLLFYFVFMIRKQYLLK
jgi:hypothetical protein